MEIREKILFYFDRNKISLTQVGKDYGMTRSAISNYLNGKRELPLSFVVWFVETYPNVDLHKLFDRTEDNIIAEENGTYVKSPGRKERILKQIEKILEKEL